LIFDLPRPATIPPGSSLRLENGAGIALRTVSAVDAPTLRIDVSDLGPGLYRLSRHGTVLAKWFADERGMNAVSPGAVIVLPGFLLSAALIRAMQADPDAEAPAYTATFGAREVLWRYHVFNAQSDDTLSIVALKKSPGATKRRDSASNGTKKHAAPSPFVSVSDPSVRDARTFEAVEPRKLTQRPAERFALRSGASTRYSPLPLAGLALGRSARRMSTLCSDIFVYL
jgi:hypothetical protein